MSDYGIIRHAVGNIIFGEHSEVDTCCKPTEEELKQLAEGDYTPQELWGVDGKPSCPKCHKKG